MWRPGLPKEGMFAAWRDDLVKRLRTLSFHHFPRRIPAALARGSSSPELIQLETEPGITVPLRLARPAHSDSGPIWLIVTGAQDTDPAWWKPFVGEHNAIYVLQPRGIGDTRWTRKNPPNYVERAHYLLGRTVDSGRVWDLAAGARYLHARNQGQVCLAGAGDAGVLAAYAALLEPDVEEVFLFQPPTSHMADSAPALLNVLRICDIPDVVGMLAPRRTTVISDAPEWRQVSARIFQSAGAEQNLVLKSP